MMKDSFEEISLPFAIDLLKNLYRLDQPMNKISEICAQLPDGELKSKLVSALGDLMAITLEDLMVPIYRQHPSLGRASEPGPWLET